MKYDFIEVGTSNFSTLVEKANDYTRGISIEPILYYLNQLPDKPGVTKLNCAISRNNKEEILDVYYVPEDVIDANGIPDYIKGCNAVGNYHKQHEWLDLKSLVTIKPIPCIPLSKLFIDYDITECDYLKLDTEGSDSDILLYFLDYLKSQDTKTYPKKITFESNILTPKEKVEKALNAYLNIGYEIEYYQYPGDESTIVYKLNEDKVMVSLYDYLGRAAGSELGKQVAEYAAVKKAKFETRQVTNPRYTGNVMLYERTLLDEFFTVRRLSGLID